MSAESTPITPEKFAAALKDLPVSSLYAKVAEIKNAVSHLQRSNAELQDFADDPDCRQAIDENVETVGRMELRVSLLKAEIEERGLVFSEHGVPPAEPGEELQEPGEAPGGAQEGQPRLDDDELARRLAERMEEDGVHL